MSSTTVPPREGPPTDLLGPIPPAGQGRVAWLAQLDDAVAKDVSDIGRALSAEGWDQAATRDAAIAFGRYLADRIVAVVAAVADDLARSDKVRP
jgi:hypothetical protein